MEQETSMLGANFERAQHVEEPCVRGRRREALLRADAVGEEGEPALRGEARIELAQLFESGRGNDFRIIIQPFFSESLFAILYTGFNVINDLLDFHKIFDFYRESGRNFHGRKENERCDEQKRQQLLHHHARINFDQQSLHHRKYKQK